MLWPSCKQNIFKNKGRIWVKEERIFNLIWKKEIVYDNIQDVKENTKKAEKELIDANYYKNQLVKSE